MHLKETVKNLWEMLLKTEITDETDFFENGGNSLLAVMMMKKLEEQTGMILKVPEIYRHSVFSDFCEMLERSSL